MPVLNNAKHELFAQEIAKGTTATEAYRKAGYSVRDDKTAAEAGSRLSRNVKVAARIEEILSEAAAKCSVTVERIISELAKIGFANMQDYIRINDDGDPVINLSDLSREQAAAIQEITVNTRTERGGEDKPDAEVKSVKFRLLDKRAALVDLGKHLGMFKEKVELTGKDGGPIEHSDTSAREEFERRISQLAARSGAQEGNSKPH